MELESGAKSCGKMMHFEPLQMLYKVLLQTFVSQEYFFSIETNKHK